MGISSSTTITITRTSKQISPFSLSFNFMLDQTFFYALFTRLRCSVCLLIVVIALATGADAQTLAPSTMTGTPSAGEYYHPSGITLSNFSFTASPGQSLRLFIGGSSVNCVPLASSLSQNQNYVVSYTPREAGVTNPADPNNANCRVMQTVQYFDGLGRPLQTVQVKGSPGGTNDIIQPVAYDAFGRETVKYLPFAAGGTPGSYRGTAISDQLSFYNPGGNGTSGTQQGNGVVVNPSPFAQTIFEPSPLNRVERQGAPGDPWQPGTDVNTEHTIRMEYGTNDANGNNAVRLFNADAVTTAGREYERTLSSPGNYQPNQLYLTIVKDENWQPSNALAGQTHEYKDKEEHIVLKRTFNTGGQVLSTYYVYDDFGNLSFVLPPGTNPDGGNIDLDSWCYQYRYDGRNRLVEKKVPGKGWEFMVYNQLDQVVMTQDPNQRNQSPQQWTFTKYDGVGRVVMTGIWTGNDPATTGYDNVGRKWLESYYATTQQPKWETPDNNTSTGYNNASDPTSANYTFLTINYYGSYTFPGSDAFGAASPSTGSGQSDQVQGLLTGSKVNILGTGTMLLTMNYYDDKGRVILSKSQNHLGGQDIVSNTWSFTDELKSSIRSHTGTSGSSVTIANRYTYDHMGRKIETWQNTNSNGEILLSKLQYNEVGQLKTKTLGAGLQSSDYAYNERGWLKSQNSAQFSMELKYNDALNGMTPQFNGNIANQVYTNNTGNTFNYTYDRLNRLTSGAASGMSEVLGYDVMGNISSLSRDGGQAGTYHYQAGNQNRLQQITDGPLATGNYAYDVNGNVTTDGRTGKTFSYNLLNLPSTVSGGITYTYLATGQKLKKVSGNVTTDYVGGIQYNNGSIEFMQTEEGLARRNGSSYSYEYNLQDHLGNVRASFYRNPGSGSIEVIQRDDYYSFGKRNALLGSTNKYLYNGKELQDETGQYDYGARFYDPVVGRFTSVDAAAEEMRSHCTYNYGLNNPMRFTDPDGNAPTDIIIRGAGNSSVTIKTELIDIEVNAQSLGVNFGGNYTVQGDDILQAGLDIVGIFDPTPISDGLNTALSANKGDWLNAGISALGIIPFAGDLAKAGKVEKDVKIVTEAVDAVRAESKVAKSEERVVNDVYKRPNNATTKEQRASVQGEACVSCGNKANKMVADHKKPLVQEHYETGTIDKNRMRSKDAVQPQCPTCSAKQGAEMSKYSKQQKKLNGLD
jgi:RHS repeat-associated protein